MPTIRLTKPTLRTLAGDPARDMLYWDTELSGFGVRVSPSGRKSYVIQYRPLGSRRAERLTLAPCDRLALDDARRDAKRQLLAAANGSDPAAARRAKKAARTVAELAPAFLDLVRAKRKTATALEYDRLMTRHVLPTLGKRLASDVTRTHINALHLDLRATPYQANRVLALAGAFFEWMERNDFRPAASNPVRHVEPYPEHKRERFLSADEFRRLGDVLARAERVGLAPAPSRRRKPAKGCTAKHRPKSADTPTPANPYGVALLRFLLVSGWREGEARTLRWDALDAARGFAVLADTKTGRSVRPLGAPALALLAEIPRLEGSPYVFAGAKDGQPLVNVTRLWEAVRHAAGLPDVRIHDLRHTFASVAASGGLSLPIIGGLLGHRQASTTQRYAHLAADPVKLAADRTAGEIAALLEHGATGRARPTVTPLASKRRRLRASGR